MNAITYDAGAYAVRDDLVAAQRLAWQRLAAPGDWLDGARRIAVADEVRRASSCDLCRRRKDALSPYSVDGDHDGAGMLGGVETEIVHRLVTDSGRLSRDWLSRCLDAGPSEEEYIEIVSVVCVVMVVDTFARGLGLTPFPLPEPEDGAPSGYRAPGARMHDAWISNVEPGDVVASDGALYDGPVAPPVVTALSLVPDAQRVYWDLAQTHYVPNTEIMNFAASPRAIDRPQIELIAARVSALHQCVY
jgi:hypothetical protein